MICYRKSLGSLFTGQGSLTLPCENSPFSWKQMEVINYSSFSELHIPSQRDHVCLQNSLEHSLSAWRWYLLLCDISVRKKEKQRWSLSISNLIALRLSFRPSNSTSGEIIKGHVTPTSLNQPLGRAHQLWLLCQGKLVSPLSEGSQTNMGVWDYI